MINVVFIDNELRLRIFRNLTDRLYSKGDTKYSTYKYLIIEIKLKRMEILEIITLLSGINATIRTIEVSQTFSVFYRK